MILACLVSAGQAATVRAMPPLEFVVLDTAASPLDGGVVAVCPAGDPCHEFQIGPDGRVRIDSELLLHHTALTIVVYDTDGASSYAISGWTATVSQRRLVASQPQAVSGVLRGTTDHGLAVELSASRQYREALPSLPASTPAPSPWRLALGLGWLQGSRFEADETALGGVSAVAPGPWASLHRRWGGRRFAQLGGHYAVNRYDVSQLDSPGESDLSFHRLGLSAGVGWCGAGAELALAAVLEYGGIYDGTTRLQRAGRDYGMAGAGLRLELSRHLAAIGGRRLGLVARAEAVHYLADESEHDHWYGTASALGLGAVVQ